MHANKMTAAAPARTNKRMMLQKGFCSARRCGGTAPDTATTEILPVQISQC